MSYPAEAPFVQSRVPYCMTEEVSWFEPLSGENMQEVQSAEKRDVVLYLSSPPKTGIATPVFAGFSKSGL
jgi:hypothetical protein